MPVTTYIQTKFGSYNDDLEIKEMLYEITKITGRLWMARTTRLKGCRGFFLIKKPGREVTELYVHQHSIEYQVITCVRTVGELRAYLLGVLSACDNKGDSND